MVIDDIDLVQDQKVVQDQDHDQVNVGIMINQAGVDRGHVVRIDEIVRERNQDRIVDVIDLKIVNVIRRIVVVKNDRRQESVQYLKKSDRDRSLRKWKMI